jgi:hypoxanthine-DNA glycosylase
MQCHPFDPIYDENSRILILGTFPSVKSREVQFYYGHPRNRFWKTLAALLQTDFPQTVEEKIRFLKEHHIALWDTCAACDIDGSADATIRRTVPNDIRPILKTADIRAIFCGGKTAGRLYETHIYPLTTIPAIVLPSTSPANAACTDAMLIDAWSAILPYLM